MVPCKYTIGQLIRDMGLPEDPRSGVIELRKVRIGCFEQIRSVLATTKAAKTLLRAVGWYVD